MGTMSGLPPRPVTNLRPPARWPRKAARRLVRDATVAAVIFAALLCLVRLHHATPDVLRYETLWPIVLPRQGLAELRDIPRNLYYMNAEDVLYCYIPKNACSRFKPLLRKREGFLDWADPSMVHGKKNGLQRLMWLSKDVAMKRLKNEGAKKFVVLRDPFSRLVSAYQNKIATPWPDQRDDFWNKHLRKECPEIVSAKAMPREGPLMSMEEFLTCLLATDAREPSNEHWRPQAELCALDHIKYDRYLHLETLADDADELLEYLGWNENATAFRMQRDPVYSEELADYFSKNALGLALKYYRQDFEVLGYPKAPSGKIDFYSVFDGTNYQPGFIPPVDFQPPVPEDTTDADLHNTAHSQ